MATDEDNGLACMRTIMGLDDWQTKYPALAYAHEQNESTSTYADGSSVWYIPAKNELKALLTGWCGLRWVASDANENIGEINDWCNYEFMPDYDGYLAAREMFNDRLEVANGTVLGLNLYWSATESASEVAWFTSFNSGSTSSSFKTSDYKVRLVRDIYL